MDNRLKFLYRIKSIERRSDAGAPAILANMLWGVVANTLCFAVMMTGYVFGINLVFGPPPPPKALVLQATATAPGTHFFFFFFFFFFF